MSSSPKEVPPSSDWRAAIKAVDLLSRQWVGELRNGRPIDDIINDISGRVRTADGEGRRALERELVSFLSIAERDREVLQLLDEISERDPDDVRPQMSKATRYLYFLEEPEEALRCIDLALQRAYRTGFFRREALGVKARILLKLRRGEQLSRVLEEIMALEMNKGIPDIGRERDFVDRAPPGLIAEDVLARYNQFRPKRLSDSDTDEPPEWEHPDDEE